MNHFKPHPGCAFEGYYSKFRLPSGAHLALIISSVHAGKARPHMVSVTYVSADGRSHWQREYWPEVIDFVSTGHDSFEMRVPGFGIVKCQGDEEFYDIKADGFRINASSVSETRQPWLQLDKDSTPAGLLVHAPLPIQWHVHTLSTDLTFSLSITSEPGELSLHDSDKRGQCIVHHEKNWARSFPAKYIWAQAWDQERQRGLCIAGGEALPGVEAYLMNYTLRSPTNNLDETITFTPPWTFGILGFSPFCHTRHDYKNGELDIDISNFTRRIKISCKAPKETFFQLSAPLPEGHRPNFACESFAATHQVTLYKRDWPWQEWSVTGQDTFTHASLEFGGGYYDDAGDKQE